MELVDIVLICIYLILAASAGVMVFSVVRRMRLGRKMFVHVNGIPAGKIVMSTVLLTLAVLAVTFLAGSGSPLAVNGGTYADALWLRVADMFIFTSLSMIVAAAAVIVYGIVRRWSDAKD